MKRGRPDLRKTISPLIMETLSDYSSRSIHSIEKEVSRRLGKNISWNTVQKYLQELIEIGKVEAVSTVHSKTEGKEGLTVYSLKRQ
jgi:TATA-binding protein-associated factor Taf7